MTKNVSHLVLVEYLIPYLGINIQGMHLYTEHYNSVLKLNWLNNDK